MRGGKGQIEEIGGLCQDSNISNIIRPLDGDLTNLSQRGGMDRAKNLLLGLGQILIQPQFLF